MICSEDEHSAETHGSNYEIHQQIDFDTKSELYCEFWLSHAMK